MEWLDTILLALGGGPIAVMLVGLTVSTGWLAKTLVAQYKERIEDQKEHSAQMLEAFTATRDVLKITEARHGS